jgi:hypothetical protein
MDIQFIKQINYNLSAEIKILIPIEIFSFYQ